MRYRRMQRDECPQGGVTLTGFVSPAGRYCGITGGKYTVIANSGTPDEKGNCALPKSRICDAEEYFRQGSACPAKS